MRINKQTNEDIQYINSHCHKKVALDPLFPYIFYTNKDVKKHNEQMLSQVDGELTCLNALDEQEDSQGPFISYEKTMTLPSRTLLKSNMLVEIYAGNYNIEDGLVNGVDAIFKTYTNT